MPASPSIGTPETDVKDYYADNRLHREAARDVARRSLVLLENREGIYSFKRGGK